MRRGFSLIELLVVIVILAILVGVAAPYYSDYVKEAKYSKAKTDLDILKQAVVLYNSREDIPYQGPISSNTLNPVPLLGESDFVGLQGQYLTNVPLDPWSKNYKLDPYGGFVYSDGPNSQDDRDNIREYYIKELALRKIEWEDSNNDRQMNANDIIYLHFNKSLWIDPAQLQGGTGGDFDVYENGVPIATIAFGIQCLGTDNVGYTNNLATASTIICRVTAANSTRLGVHSVAFKDEIAKLQKYQEVTYDRNNSSSTLLRTRVEMSTGGTTPLRFAVRTNPIKIVQKD